MSRMILIQRFWIASFAGAPKVSHTFWFSRALFFLSPIPFSVQTKGMKTYDAVMIGGGVMSATLATLLKELSPSMSVQVYEKLGDLAAESSAVLNNAGTGHSALCELNYSPEDKDGNIPLDKATHILEMFEVSKQFWSYLVTHKKLPSPDQFIHSIPHMSLVWGEKNRDYLKRRYQAMKASHLFSDIEYSEDPAQLKAWMPLVMEGQNCERLVAASRNKLGTDLNFQTLTKSLFTHLKAQGVGVSLQHEVKALKRTRDGFWEITVFDQNQKTNLKVRARFLFIGAGGNALPLLEESGIKEVKGYGGFPVGGQWLICKNEALIQKHDAKVYGLASVGAPPMSVPHLDTRIVDGKKQLLFGPFATFSFKFLKTGSQWDLIRSLVKSPGLSNLVPILSVGIHNLDLTRYLISQLLLSFSEKVDALREFVPGAREEDWESHDAGQRVQVIKRPTEKEKTNLRFPPEGILEFGTEVVTNAEGSLAALLGASPGASCAVSVMLEILEKCFPEQMKTEAWQKQILSMIPTYGKKLADDPALTQETRARTHQILELLS